MNRLLLHDAYAKAVNEPMNYKLKLIYAIPRCIRRMICKINEHRIMLDPMKYNGSMSIVGVALKQNN